MFHCTKNQDKLKIAQNAVPGIMTGWKRGFGFCCTGVFVVADHDTLREKKVAIALVLECL